MSMLAIAQDIPQESNHPRALPFVTPVIRDRFNRANGPLGNAADGNLVRPWLVDDGLWVVDGNMARPTATPAGTTGTPYYARVAQFGIDNVIVSAVLGQKGGISNTTNGAGIFAMYLSANTHIRVGINGAATGWRVQVVLNGTFPLVVPTGVAENVGDRVTLQVIGNAGLVTITPADAATAPTSVTFTIPDAFLAAVTAATSLDSGIRVLRQGSNASAALDDFECRYALAV